ncbi:MAG: branched-chain amino acid ABC transporter permease [Devosia sp.]
MRFGLQLIGFAVFAVLMLAVVPLIIAATGRSDLYYTLTLISLLAVASAGVWITFAIGRINIGQAAYALIGGYVSAILVTRYGVPFWWTIPLAGLFAALISMLIGLPILRLRGVYFAMVTLVSTEVARLAALALPITNGAKGMVNLPLPGPIALGPLMLVPDFATLENPRIAFYLLSIVVLLLTFAGVWRLTQSRLGRLFVALQQNEELASSTGINIAGLRVIAYAISSFLGGVAGAVFSAVSQSVYPSSFTTADSINFMLNCFLGGLGYVFGPIVGTFVLRFGWDLLFSTEKWQLLIYSGALIALMLVLPNGILSLIAMRLPKRGAR